MVENVVLNQNVFILSINPATEAVVSYSILHFFSPSHYDLLTCKCVIPCFDDHFLLLMDPLIFVCSS